MGSSKFLSPTACGRSPLPEGAKPKAAGSTDGTAIRDALYGVDYDGVTGSITFDQTTGDANKDMAYIKKAADGAFEFVKTQSVEG
mgnify:CR=1 FL=1